MRRAKDHGKPMLVFVLPADTADEQRWRRGQWFGAFLNHGGAAALDEVALCIPVCATIADVRAVTGAAAVDGTPLLLVVDVSRVGVPDAPAPRVTPLVLDLGDPPTDGTLPAGVGRLATELQRTIRVHAGATAELAEAARAAMSDEQRAAVAAFVADGKIPDDELVVRAAAMVREAASKAVDPQRTRMLDALRAAADRTLVRRRLPGGLWRRTEGCGAATEDENGKAVEVGGIECGMGRVNRLCERFLDLYTSP